MKLQDFLFLILFVLLFLKKEPKYFTLLGLIFLFLSIPLFAKYVFFTAERLTWYSAALFLIAAIVEFFDLRKSKD